MPSIKLPIRFENGRMGTVSALPTIVEQKIINYLVTNYFERVMRPNLGGNTTGMLFEPKEPLVWDDYKASVINDIGDFVTGAVLKDITVSNEEAMFGGETGVVINVRYLLPPASTSRSLSIPIDASIARNYY